MLSLPLLLSSLADLPAADGSAGGAPQQHAQLARCDYSVGGPTVSSRSNTIQQLAFGAVAFAQDCDEAEARGPGILNLTSLGVTELVAGEMASIEVLIRSCTLAWPFRYGEVWLDWRGSGQFERLVDSVGGTYEPSMTGPFQFRFRVPADAALGETRLRVGTYECGSCFREAGEWERLNPCHEGTDVTMADLAVRIVAPPSPVAAAVAALPPASADVGGSQTAELSSKTARISNVEPRRDTEGNILNAHDGALYSFEPGHYLLIGTSYYECEGFTNCSSHIGDCGWQDNNFRCGKTPFVRQINSIKTKPRSFYQDRLGTNVGKTPSLFSRSAYSSTDLQTWKLESSNLLPTRPRGGANFRPKILKNKAGTYVMWFNFQPPTPNIPGWYSVATSKVRQNGLLSHLCIEMMILPRQARDKHREYSKPVEFFEERDWNKDHHSRAGERKQSLSF
jgi:hypothetical protein